jgi:hypothetical protein
MVAKIEEPKLDPQVEDCLRAVHELSTQYWSLSQKTVKLFHPKQQMKGVMDSIVRRLATISFALTNLSQDGIPKLSAKFSKDHQPHLVTQLTFAQRIVDAVYVHYKKVDPELTLHKKVRQDQLAKQQAAAAAKK